MGRPDPLHQQRAVAWTEPYTRRITKPSQVLGQSNGAAQALVRYTECRALLGGTTCSQGLTLANAGGVTKLYAGLLRNPEAPDDPRLSPAGTNIANPETGGALAYLETLAGHSCYLQHLSEGTDTTARGWFERLRSKRIAGPSTTACVRSTARRWTPTTSGGWLAGERRWCGRRSATTCCTARPPTSAPPRRPTCRSRSARTGHPAGRRTCSVRSRWPGWPVGAARRVFTPRELAEMVTINPARHRGGHARHARRGRRHCDRAGAVSRGTERRGAYPPERRAQDRAARVARARPAHAVDGHPRRSQQSEGVRVVLGGPPSIRVTSSLRKSSVSRGCSRTSWKWRVLTRAR